MSGAMNRHCIPGLTMSTALTGNFSADVGIIKTMHTGFKSAYTYCIMPTPGADTEETGRYDLAWDCRSVLNALSK